MTLDEFSRVCAGLSAEQLMPYLREAETAVGAVYPATERYSRIYLGREETVKVRDGLLKNRPGFIVVFVVFAMISVAVFFLGLVTLETIGFLVFSLPSALFLMIFGIIGILSNNNSLKKTNKNLTVLENELLKADADVKQLQDTHNNGQLIRMAICPNECKNPENMRVFVNFFETGRARNLNEAKNLFDEYMYRKNMQDIAKQQMQYSFDARTAAYEARAAAERAATNASNASTAASRAEFYTRFK
ncbi:MAG: hypothetical protein IJ316_04930 [Clostridia bacterium]|nr:hypothetical protein [Clostridia bacterium]